jgi:signal transduction histidine kinase/ActR/RegA family two-component response regulator
LALFCGVSLLAFELMYYALEEPTGPLWLRICVASSSITFFLVTQFAPSTRRFAEPGIAVLAVMVVAENTYRMHLVDFTITHSMPMLIVLAGAGYAFRNQRALTLFMLTAAIGLTMTMAITPNSEISAPIYIGSVWALCVLTIILFGSHITEHDQLRVQEQLLSSVFDGTQGGLMLLEDGALALANDRARNLLGTQTDDELVGKIERALNHHYGVPENTSITSHLVFGLHQAELGVDVDGKTSWLDVHLRSHNLNNKLMIVISLYDLSEQRQAIAALTRSELLLEQSQRVGQIGSWDVNLGTNEHWWSPEMFRIFNLEAEHQLSMTQAIGLLDPEAQQACWDAIMGVKNIGERVDVEAKAEIRPGQITWLKLTGEVVELQGEMHLVGITQNVTAEKQHQEALIQSKVTAEEALKVRGKFLANMSHEIRTPMNGVIGMTSLLMATELSESQRDTVQTIKHSGESLLHLINDILDFSKIDADRMEFEALEFSLNSLTQDLLRPLQLQASQKDLSFQVITADDLPLKLTGDIKRIEQIVTNLVGNAIKFTETGGIIVSFAGHYETESHYQLTISVDDTGIGIKSSRINHLFEPFTQEDTSTTRRFGGTGLGLAITKRLVDLMAGTIEASSKPGKGTRFEVTLPLVANHSSQFVSQPLEQDNPHIHKCREDLRILLAEDNLVNQKVASKMLSKLGYPPVVVCNGQEAIDSIHNGDFDLVLMDVQMPEVDGLTATKSIRAMTDIQQPIVIALTANAMQSDQDACLAAGMDDFMAKPITLESLSRTLAKRFPA